MRKFSIISLVAQFILVLFISMAYADGMLIPTIEGAPPLSIKSQRVAIDIMTNVAKTKIVQEFFNNTNQRLEANYVFPLPAEASISDFAMFINGKRTSGELVEKEKARAVYEEIVRKMRDPALLEYMGNNIFRVRVFPIEPHSTQKIELEYSQVVTYDNNIYCYTYPLKTGMQATRTLEDFTVGIDLKSNVPIKNIYSPTHEVGISRKDDYRAVIGFEKSASYLNKDFKLFYTVSDKEIGLNLLTYKRNEDEDGYFMLMLAPKVEVKKGDVNKKNIVFTIDTSGSMAGEKMRSAINALNYCINNLNEQDSFNIVRFSTDTELFKDKLVSANKENISAALSYVSDMRAAGGTAIDSALAESLKLFTAPKEPNILVFLTDGLPTIGSTDAPYIIKNAANNNKNAARIFSFGVGYDVNTILLDSISKDGRGLSEYLQPSEEIEIKLSAFFNKVANPVISNISIDYGKVKADKFYPKNYPDIFKGNDIVIFGKYKGNGATAITLIGAVAEKEEKFVYEGTFASADTKYDFIPRLWAVRRVGYLLEEIKIHGADKELKDEVIALSKQYGIMTPYTSYLVLENDQQYAQYGIEKEANKPLEGSSITSPHKDADKRPNSTGFRLGGSKGAREHESPATPPADYYHNAEGATSATSSAPASEPRISAPTESMMKAESGADAVRISRDIRSLKEESKQKVSDEISLSKVVKGKTFVLLANDYWTESSIKGDMKTTLKVKYMSNAYFNLISAFPEIKEYLSIGEKVKLLINGKLLIIDNEGEESMSAEKIKEYFK